MASASLYIYSPLISCSLLGFSRVSSNLVHDTDKRDLSALHWAIYYDHAEHLKLLLKRYVISNQEYPLISQ